MAIDGNTGHIGELIRQLRRQRNLTQSELGATRYSKSYVSAVEKNSIDPSTKALQFFAEQLDQPADYFTRLLVQTEDLKLGTALLDPMAISDKPLQDEEFPLLYLLLQHTESLSRKTMQSLPTFSPEFIAALPPSKQAYYALLEGVTDQAKQEHEAALHAFERALPLASTRLLPAVLDALGQHYFLTKSFSTALHYHLRALTLLKQADPQETMRSLLFTVALHCGEDYRALGAYEQACAMYEQARTRLGAEHELKNAALLYLGLGYCTYALTYQLSAEMLAATERVLSGETESGFQRAIGFFVQSKNVYQVSGDRLGEATTRLFQALAELDSIARNRHVLKTVSATFAASGLSLLADAEEQCRQILLSWQDTFIKGTPANDAIIYLALAYLVQVFIQRAILARLRGQDSVALHERILAAHLCQRVVDSLSETAFPTALLQEVLSLRWARQDSTSPPVPRLPDLNTNSPAFHVDLIGRVEIYFAAGEVAEELGRTATSSNYKHDCYTLADRCFHAALTSAHTIVSAREHDPGYLVRCHQRYTFLLEERLTTAPEEREETSRMLLAQLKEGLYQLQSVLD